jgi:hypothetical protein
VQLVQEKDSIRWTAGIQEAFQFDRCYAPIGLSGVVQEGFNFSFGMCISPQHIQCDRINPRSDGVLVAKLIDSLPAACPRSLGYFFGGIGNQPFGYQKPYGWMESLLKSAAIFTPGHTSNQSNSEASDGSSTGSKGG